MTDDANKPPPKAPGEPTDDGWDQPASDPIDPATGYVMHPADPAHPHNRRDEPAALPEPAVEPPDPATGYVSYSSPAIDPTTGQPYPTIDPTTGQPYAPTIDPTTGLSTSAVDPVTGLPVHGLDPSANPDDAPILPATYDPASLRGDAAAPQPPPGTAPPAKPPKKTRRNDDEDGADPHKAGRRTGWIIAGSIVAGIAIVTFALFGRENSSHYYITCDADKIVATQGRGFPPWGSSPLPGAEWKPITIAANAECTPQDTENLDELEGWYLKALIDQATSLLTAREVTKPDLAAEQLNQGLLLARAETRRDQRKEIERLLGDVDYWRASAKLRDAANALGDAAKQFDTASAQRPRHVSDAAAWATYIRKLVDQLHAGPTGGSQGAFPPLPSGAERPFAPPGVALPVEPDHGSDVAPVAPPDAGTPGGGVLL